MAVNALNAQLSAEWSLENQVADAQDIWCYPVTIQGVVYRFQRNSRINANGDHYTIQVAASFNRSALLKVSKNLFRHVRSVPDTELCGSYWIVTSYRAKSPWYFLVFGNYASRKLAMDDVAKLPGSLYFDPKENKLIDDEDIVTSKPYVRRISQVQADMHRVVNQGLIDFNKTRYLFMKEKDNQYLLFLCYCLLEWVMVI